MHINLATSSHIFSTLSDRNHPSTDQTPNPFYCCFWSRSGNWKGFPVYSTESYKVVVCSGTSKTPILLSLPDPAVRHCRLIGLNTTILLPWNISSQALLKDCWVWGTISTSPPIGNPKLSVNISRIRNEISMNISATWPCNAVSVNSAGNSAHKLDHLKNYKTDTKLWS